MKTIITAIKGCKMSTYVKINDSNKIKSAAKKKYITRRVRPYSHESHGATELNESEIA